MGAVCERSLRDIILGWKRGGWIDFWGGMGLRLGWKNGVVGGFEWMDMASYVIQFTFLFPFSVARRRSGRIGQGIHA